MDTLAQRVVAVIAKTQRLLPDAVTPDSTFAELKIDSLDGINIVFALESEFDVSIPDEAARKIASVRQAIDGITELLAQKAAPSASAQTVP